MGGGDPPTNVRARVVDEGLGGASMANRMSAQRLEQSGHREEALKAYVQLKMLGDAGRVAYQLGRFGDAGRLYVEAGMPYEAAVSFMKGGDTGACIEAIISMPRLHEKYRASCMQAIRLSRDSKYFDFKLDQFLSKFIAEGPKGDAEIDVFYMLADIYLQRDFPENARELYEKIEAVKPSFKDVSVRLGELRKEAHGSGLVYEAIAREEVQFRQGGGARKPMPSANVLPELPDLPSLDGFAGAHSPNQPQAPRRPGPVAQAVAPPGRSAETSSAKTEYARPLVPAKAIDPADVTVGTTIADRYRVEKKLGEGGMASVYMAHDLELSERIALKLFFNRTDEGLLTRFKQELSLSRQLAHPNIVRLYDLGTYEGFKFITMELLEGTDLASVLEGHPMEFGLGLNYLGQICQGLALAHEKGVIHRDIKPANFFVTSQGLVKVMDFGIAKGKQNAGLTVAGFIAGTPHYMSPEQINNFASVTHLSDIYSLGIMAYEMFTGTLPFDHSELMGLLRMHQETVPEPPSARNPEIPQELEDLILRMIAKDPAARVQSCRDLANMLSELRPRGPRRPDGTQRQH
jgi:hypothetical protein